MPSITAGTRSRVVVVVLLLTVVAACQDATGPSSNQAPVASFVVTTAAGPAPLTVGFDATGSSDADGVITSYLWSFGDGGSATGVTTSHTYADPGVYPARLTVTDDRGATAIATLEIEVGEAAGGSISGRISAGAAAGQALPLRPPGVTAWSASAAPIGEAADLVPGDLIVKFAPGLQAQALAPLSASGVRLDAVRDLAVEGARLYRNAGLSRAATLALAHELQARPDVLYAQPNYILQPSVVPDDQFYGFQWHYPAINLPAAWDITTGSPDTVVAVVDTGILFRTGDAAASHPDFAGKVLPGYDFISDPNFSQDGSGRDADPYDEGFDVCTDSPACTLYESSYHGTHVGGTIAAATDNGIGVAGVDWQAKIVPVRVLGRGGGSILDIVEGTLWAAGFAVPGVPPNANPAHVINLSLGGPGSCSPYEQEAYDRIASSSPRNAIVVVAAGNQNQNAAAFTPANCGNVMTVGATEFRDHRAPYSNYGSRIDVMAPGGDMSIDRNGDTYPDGVLSLFRFDGTGGGFDYWFQQGTSMAAPHVAGVVSLMKALQPSLGLHEALAVLQATARPLSAAACGRPAASDCGAGLIDAAAALTMLQSGSIPNPGGGALAISPNPLDFGGSREEMTITLTNTSSVDVAWAMDGFEPSPGNPGAMLDGSVYLPSGAVADGVVGAGLTATTALGIDRAKVTADGAYQFSFFFDVAGVEQWITVRFGVGAAAGTVPAGPMVVGAFLLDEAGDLVLSGFHEEDAFFSEYDFGVSPGDNIVIAWLDANDNLVIDAGDYVGIYPDFVPVAAAEHVPDVDFAIDRVIEVGTLGSDDAAPPDRPRWRQLSDWWQLRR